MSQPVAARDVRRPRRWGLVRWRPTRATVALLLGAVALAAAWHWHVPDPIPGLLLGVELVLVTWIVQTHSLHLAGPLLAHDLTRLARRGGTILLRCTYGLLLLGWLCYLVVDHFPEYARPARFFDEPPARSIHDWARFAQRFVGTILTAQGIAVLLLTPAYLASAIAEEKERKTILLLLTTDLRDREILLGKLLGRLLHLACLLLTGLPILCLARLWGGVDEKVLLAAFVVNLLGLLSVGSVSILCSVLARTVLGAVIGSYGLVAFLGFFCFSTEAISFVSVYENRVNTAWDVWQEQMANANGIIVPGLPPPPPVVIPRPDPDAILAELLLLFVAGHGTLFLLCTGVAISQLRARCLEPGNPALPTPVPRALVLDSWGPAEPLLVEPLLVEPLPVHWGTPPPFSYPSLPVRDPALLWKEIRHNPFGEARDAPLLEGLRQRWREVFAVALCGSVLAALVLGPFGPAWAELCGMLNNLLRGVTIVLAGGWCVLVAFRVSGSVTRERAQRTLENLLLLPVDRSEILAAKWLGSILCYKEVGLLLAFVWVVGLAIGLLRPWALLLLVVACGATLAFVASIGLWLSLTSRNTLWANMTMALVLLVLFGTAWLQLIDASMPSPTQDLRWGDVLLEVGLNPARAWWFAGFTWQDCATAWANADRLFFYRTTAGLAGAVLYGTPAWVFWRLSCRRFEKRKEPRRHRDIEKKDSGPALGVSVAP